MFTINKESYSAERLVKTAREKVASGQSPEWERDIWKFLLDWFSEEDHIMVNTSGSTGKPRKIALRKSSMSYSARQTIEFFGISEQSTLLLCIPAAFIGGKMMIVRAMLAGCDLVINEPAANPFAITKQKIDLAAITPYQLSQAVETLHRNELIHSIIVGGGEIHPELEMVVNDLSANLFSTYGMTETSSHIALRRLNGDSKQQWFSVLGNTEIEIDGRGCLVIRNPELFDGELITNDLAEIIDKKSFKWLGRFDNIINTGGIKVIPEEIEKEIKRFIDGELVVTSVESKEFGQEVVLLLEDNNDDETKIHQIKKMIDSRLPGYQRPKKIYFTKLIPRTLNGKIDRKAASQLAMKIPTTQ